MGASIAIDGFGAILKKNGVALPRGELTSIPFPSVTVELYEVSHAASPGRFRERKAGWKDTEPLEFEMNYTQSDYLVFKSLLDAGAISTFQLVIADENFPVLSGGQSTPYWSFQALVTGIPADLPLAEGAPMTPTLQITGEPKFVQGT